MDSLINRYKSFLAPILSNVASTVGNTLAPGVSQLLHSAPVNQAVNSVANTKFIPGQVHTLAEAYKSVLADPRKSLLSTGLTSGFLNSGNKAIDTNIYRPTGHALNALIQGSSAGLINPPSPRTYTLQDKIGTGVGLAASLINPYSVGGKVLGPLGEGVTGVLGAKLGKTAIPKLVTKGIGALGSEAAQTGVLTAANTALGNKFDPVQAFMQGVGLRGLGGAAASINPALSNKEGFPVKTGFKDILAEKQSVVDTLKRYETTLGDMSGKTGTHNIDMNLYPDLVKHWQTIYGANKKPPADMSRIVDEVKDGLRAALSLQRKGVGAGFPGMGIIDGASYTGKVAKQTQQDFTNTIRQVKEYSTNQNEAVQSLNQMVDAAIADSKGDKNVLAGLTTALRKEADGITGQNGGFKQNYATKQVLKKDPENGAYLANLEEQIARIEKSVGKPAVDANSSIIKQTRPGDYSNSRDVNTRIAKKFQDRAQPTGAKPTPAEQASMDRFQREILDSPTPIKDILKELPPPIEDITTTTQRARAMEYAQKENASKFNSVFNPLKNQEEGIQKATIEHDRANKVAQVKANQVANDFKTNLDPETEWKLVQYSQNPTKGTAKALGLTEEEISANQELLTKHARYNDELFKRTGQEGMDVNYRYNHIYQQWAQHPEEIDNILAARGLGSKAGFQNARQIENFQQGVELGLTPKYTTFGQLNAGAEHNFNKTLANQEYANKLIKSGQLLPASEAPGSWEPITARFFPKASMMVGKGEKIDQTYHAPPELANFINNYFGGQQMSFGDKILNKAAGLSSSMQNAVLSGGVGPLNFFGIGQMVKEGTAGRFVTPIKAFARSFSREASLNFEREKSPVIREMASQGISPRGIGNYQNVYKNVVENKPITKILGDKWHELIDEPTFGRLMNQLQIGFYEDTKNSLVKKGMSPEQAIQVAGGATKKFYGMSENLGRSQSIQDSMTSIFMAPQYRESMVNIFKEMGKSFKPGNITNPENRGLQKLALGMALTFAAYNVAQKNLTGKYMWQNPPGKEGELVVPVGDPKNNKYISIPWMPGFTAVPRRVAGTVTAAAKGDLKEAASQAGGLLSIPLSRGLDLVRNQDYFGNEIVRDGSQVKDIASYAAGSFLPGYANAALNVAQGKATPAMGVAQALELPIKKGTFPNPYFTAKDEAMKGLSKDEKVQADFLLQADKLGGPDSATEASILVRNPNLIDLKKKIALASNPQDALYTRPNQDILAYQAYKVATDPAIKAQIMVKYPWIPKVQFALSQQMYNSQQTRTLPTAGYDPNSVQGKLGELLNPAAPQAPTTPMKRPMMSPKQALTPQQVQIASAYTALPSGSAGRKQLLAQNPWLKTYWNINDAYYQANPYTDNSPLAGFLRTQGINPDTSNSSFAKYSPKVKKIKIPKVKKAKILRVKKPKISKIKSYKLTKVKKVGRLKLT